MPHIQFPPIKEQGILPIGFMTLSQVTVSGAGFLPPPVATRAAINFIIPPLALANANCKIESTGICNYSLICP
jgi:hypothetical protein